MTRETRETRETSDSRDTRDTGRPGEIYGVLASCPGQDRRCTAGRVLDRGVIDEVRRTPQSPRARRPDSRAGLVRP